MEVKIFRPKIIQILRDSDIETVSAKKVRKQLQAESGLDLSEYKTELDKYIKECFATFTADGDATNASDPRPPPIKKAKREPVEPVIKTEEDISSKKRKVKTEHAETTNGNGEDADARYARELQAALNQTRSSRSGGAKPVKKVKRKRKTETIINSDGETVEVEIKKKRAPANNAFNKLLTLSEKLSDLVGHQYLSRPQVSKHVWAYIKDRGLQDPKDKRYINCDDKLQGLLGTPRVHMFTMTKLLQPMMIDDGSAPIGVGQVATGDPELIESDDEAKVIKDEKKEEKIVKKEQKPDVKRVDSESEDSDW